jgi:hypothetical protein
MSARRRGFNRALTNDYRLAQHNVRVFWEGFGGPFFTQKRSPENSSKPSWLGREDSNLRMRIPKTRVLPLDDAPVYLFAALSQERLSA